MQPAERQLCTIEETGTLEEALGKIEANGLRTVIVLNAQGQVTGTLSDGDARKAILNRRLVSTQVRQLMNLNFLWLAPGEEARAPAMFERHHIFVIPVIGKQNELLDVLKAY